MGHIPATTWRPVYPWAILLLPHGDLFTPGPYSCYHTGICLPLGYTPATTWGQHSSSFPRTGLHLVTSSNMLGGGKDLFTSGPYSYYHMGTCLPLGHTPATTWTAFFLFLISLHRRPSTSILSHLATLWEEHWELFTPGSYSCYHMGTTCLKISKRYLKRHEWTTEESGEKLSYTLNAQI